MARRSARRTYVRDGRGRFASTGTTTAKAKPAARRAQRGTNRITRDNSGKITGVGKNGATARGGRLRTAAGNQRGAVLDRLKRAPMAGTVGGRVRRDPGAMGKTRKGAVKPQKSVKLSASQRSAAQRARDTFNDPLLLLNGRIAKGYKEGIQAIQQKFGVNNRIATLAFMRRAFRMGTSDIQYIDTARTKKTIKALRARTAIGSPIGGSSRKAKAPAIPGTVSRGRRKTATARLAAPKGRIDKIRAKRAGGLARLRKPAPKPPQPAKLPTGRTVYRTRAQAIRAQQARTNTLGKATAAKRGFNEVSAANFRARIAGQRGNQQMFADSAPRTVISRPRIPQLSLSGRVERVGAGRFRTVGERLGGGSIRRSRSKPGPLRGTKAWKRQLEQAIKANGGKDVAAFRF